MDGRVKTLHPRIHGGLLGRRGIDDAVMAQARHPADRPAGRESVSVRADGRETGLHLRGRDREHRHRRAGDGARRGQESRIGDGRRRSGRLRPGARASWTPTMAPPASTRARASPPRRSRTPRSTTPWCPNYLLGRESDDASIVSGNAAAGVRKDPGPALRREPAPAGGVLSRARAAAARAWPAPPCSRARSSRSTTSPTPTPPSNACASSTSPPASSSSTPIPAASPRPCRWPTPTTAPIAPIPTSAFGGIIAFNRALDAATATAIIEPPVRRGHRRAVGVRGGRGACSRARPNVRVLVHRRARQANADRARIPQRGRRPAGAEPRHRARAARHLQGRHAKSGRRRRSTRTCGSPGACAST